VIIQLFNYQFDIISINQSSPGINRYRRSFCETRLVYFKPSWEYSLLKL